MVRVASDTSHCDDYTWQEQVRISTANGDDGRVELSEAHVVEREDGQHREEWLPLQDEDVQQVVRLLGLDRPEAALALQHALAVRSDFGDQGGRLLL